MKPGFFAVCIVAVLFLSSNAFAQPHLVGKGEYVRPAAVSVPDPEFPEAAKESGLGGRVSVNVKLNESGNVISADASTGPGNVCPSVTRPDVTALRDAARSAALKATFSPAMRDGKPVASNIMLDFDFPETARKTGKTDNVIAHSPPSDYTGPVKTSGRYTVKGDKNFSVATADATQQSQSGNTLPGGVLNGYAKSLPKPPYPAAARAVRASGTVSIKVLIDTDGSVFSAVPESGHPLLRSASRIAACNASFSPTQLSGKPVKVMGIITYNFIP